MQRPSILVKHTVQQRVWAAVMSFRKRWSEVAESETLVRVS